ncbi:signal peptidase complex subunit 2, putative [Plasmodium gallinaceum]|uniref:Signal peptidase complex subunit 2 n=1 Tax=Plasmodium gallinaceum TaxID=5849 RepID=A0A1J1GPM2_PLAGA|nr:signal peptidase complex subunit 2, putative [Plasmodium gallinaceum]CRG94252.1 signal peptidase complex subunit 2, putative [Plasmodium gallinaceum]
MPSKKVSDSNENTYHVNNLYSEQEIKKVTQDYISEKIRELNYMENVHYSNIRILLSLILIFIGSYCSIFVQYKKNPLLMIKLLIAFFVVSVVLFMFEYFYFENAFMILKTNNDAEVKLSCKLDKEKSSLSLVFASNKKVHSTHFDLKKLFNENGYLIRNYAENILKEFLLIQEKNFKLKNGKK